MFTSTNKSAVRDFFLYALLAGTFYFVMFDVVSLLFSYIDELLPDVAVNSYNSFPETIRWRISSLIVLFPVYLVVAWFLRKDLNKHTEKADFFLRKFFIYLTLFITAISLIADMIALINGYLDGDLSTRFVLKVCVVFAVALGVGWYFWYELKRGADSRPSKAIAVTASVLALLVVGFGLYLAGSPGEARMLRLDNERVSHVMQLSNSVDNYWRTNNKLPQSIDAVEKLNNYANPVDPETQKAYEYKVLAARKYQVCASFTGATPKDADDTERPTFSKDYYYNMSTDPLWNHKEGRQCYQFEIKDRYPNDGQIPYLESVLVTVQ